MIALLIIVGVVCGLFGVFAWASTRMTRLMDGILEVISR